MKRDVLNSRITRFLRMPMILLKDETPLDWGKTRLWVPVITCIDKENRNLLIPWRRRKVTDTTKHTHNQAICIYAFLSHYDGIRGWRSIKACQRTPAALWLESKCTHWGWISGKYLPKTSAELMVLSLEMVKSGLSKNHEHTVMCLEAYTEFYRFPRWRGVGELQRIADAFADKVYNWNLRDRKYSWQEPQHHHDLYSMVMILRQHVIYAMPIAVWKCFGDDRQRKIHLITETLQKMSGRGYSFEVIFSKRNAAKGEVKWPLIWWGTGRDRDRIPWMNL